MRTGFIGLGSQGGPMARRIAEAGFPLTLWARRPEATAAFADTGAAVAATPRELAAASELVCLCVVGDADVRQVLDGPDGVLAGLARGAVVAVHSTVHPDTCRDIAATAARAGAHVVDAPVSGGGEAAGAGRLLVMAGGEDEAVRRCLPVFESYAGQVEHLGAVGAGQVAKLLNNLLFTANLATVATTFALAADLGVDPARLGGVLAGGTANSFALAAIAGSGGSVDVIAAHAGELLRKDVGLLRDLADRAGARPGAVVAAADAALALMRTG